MLVPLTAVEVWENPPGSQQQHRMAGHQLSPFSALAAIIDAGCLLYAFYHQNLEAMCFVLG
jgi:hypothetical protein